MFALARPPWLVAAGLALLGQACHPDSTATPATKAAPLDAPSAVATAVAPGEFLAGKIYILGVEAARAEIEACRDAEGQVHVHLEAGSVGLAATLQAARMEMDTVLAADGLRPQTNWADADVGGKLRRYDVRFRPGAYDYVYHRNSGPTVQERIRLAPGEDWAHDLHTGVLMLRDWRPRPGTSGRFVAVLGRHLWITDAVFRGPDMVVTDDGPYPAVRIEGVTRKQHPDPAQREVRHFQVWFSDDPDRVPMRAKTESAFGDIWLEMTEYRRDPARVCRDHARVIPLPSDPLAAEAPPPPAPPPPADPASEIGW